MALESCSFNGVNLSVEQCQAIVTKINANTSFTDILNNPFLWLFGTAMVIMIFVYLIWGRGSKGDPSTKPWWGRIVRKELMQKEVKNRAMNLGTPCKIHIRWGTTKIGQADRIENDTTVLERLKYNAKTGRKEIEKGGEATIVRLYYRRYGLINWLKAIFGFGYQGMILTAGSFLEHTIGKNGQRIEYHINPRAHIINDSGIWVLDDERAYNAGYELLLKADDENLHGSGLDMLRRLSVHQAGVASALEKMSHEADIKRQEKLDRRATFVSGGN